MLCGRLVDTVVCTAKGFDRSW